jgi:tRNA(Arg) A34 adenosine deaminase TadA
MNYNAKFMTRALEIARENIDQHGGPFGAVIVRNEIIIAEAGNSVTKKNDPTAHAEIEAIRMATTKINSFDLTGCVIYSSCEPCPMCLGAIYWAHLDKLFFAGTRIDAAKAGFDDEFIYTELTLPPEKRHLPSENIQQTQAIDIFKYWTSKENKIEY